MKISLDTLIALGSLLIGFGTALCGAVLWYGNSEKKRYGIERDFAHVRRNQEQMSQSLNTILSEIDRRFDIMDRDVLEIKTYLDFQRKFSEE